MLSLKLKWKKKNKLTRLKIILKKVYLNYCIIRMSIYYYEWFYNIVLKLKKNTLLYLQDFD